MAQKILIVLTALAALVLNIAQANSAQLSTNPWLEANDDEAVAELLALIHITQTTRQGQIADEGGGRMDRRGGGGGGGRRGRRRLTAPTRIFKMPAKTARRRKTRGCWTK